MLAVLLALNVITNNTFSYDAVIKDTRGRVKGYLYTDANKTYILDTRGRRSNYIESDGTIKDIRGRKKGTIKKDN